MAGIHTTKQVARTMQCHRLALAVARKLRALGHADARAIDACDLLGARIIAHDVYVCGLRVIVRPYGHKLTPLEWQAINGGAVLQTGAHKIDDLARMVAVHVARVNLASASHWRSDS